MKGFHGVGAAQRFLSAPSGVPPPFRPRRRLMTAAEHHLGTTTRFTLWNHITRTIGRPTRA